MDRHQRLVREAREVFDQLGLTNVTAFTADGSFGLLRVRRRSTASLSPQLQRDPPGPLLAQLKVGGIMVLPVGQSDAVQHLIRVRRTPDGLDYDELRPVRFVPLVEGVARDG